MFKGYDYVVGEIIECDNKQGLLEELNDRFTWYKEDYKDVRCICIKGIYYLICGSRRSYSL